MAFGRGDWRRVKRHRSYSVGEAAQLLRVSKLTVRRWLKDGLAALTEKRPTLILGQDLADFLRTRAKPKIRLRLNELFCFRCRSARRPAGDMLDYIPRTTHTGTVTGLCAVCETVMHKAVSAAKLIDLKRTLDVSFPRGEPQLNDTIQSLLNVHSRQEPKR